MSEKLQTNTGKGTRDEIDDLGDSHTTKKRVKRDLVIEYDMYCEGRDLVVQKEIQNSRIVLNVGGARFETSRRTPRNHQHSGKQHIFSMRPLSL